SGSTLGTLHRVAIGRLALDDRPIERALPPDIEVADEHESDEEQHLDESEQLQLAIDHRPGIQKHGFDVEQDEDHRHQIKLDAESVFGVTCGCDATLVRSILLRTLQPASQHHGQGREGYCEPQSDHDLDQDGKVVFKLVWLHGKGPSEGPERRCPKYLT